MADKAVIRTDFAAKAQEWLNYITEMHPAEIAASIHNSNIYSPDFHAEAPATPTRRISLMDTDSVRALFALNKDCEATVFNFASYKYPGGMFLDSSTAQEEALCHRSTLFPVLTSFDEVYYAPNRKNLNRGLYTNRVIFSKGVLFYNHDNSEQRFANVLTCASPNWLTAQKYYGVSKSENNREVRERLKWLNEVLANEQVNVFIAGAWGCGVFRQNPTFMARAMVEELTYPEWLIFAIPSGNNFIAFDEELKKGRAQ